MELFLVCSWCGSPARASWESTGCMGSVNVYHIGRLECGLGVIGISTLCKLSNLRLATPIVPTVGELLQIHAHKQY